MNLQPAPNGFFCRDDPGEPGSGNPRWSVNNTEARIVSELFRGLVVLEIGTGLGVATREIARRAAMVYTVDVDEWVEKNVVPTLPKNTQFFREIKSVPEGLDAAFIDGLHSYGQCSRDIQNARRIVHPGGLIVFHDTAMDVIMKAIVDQGLKPVPVQTYAGMAICWNE